MGIKLEKILEFLEPLEEAPTSLLLSRGGARFAVEWIAQGYCHVQESCEVGTRCKKIQAEARAIAKAAKVLQEAIGKASGAVWCEVERLAPVMGISFPSHLAEAVKVFDVAGGWDLPRSITLKGESRPESVWEYRLRNLEIIMEAVQSETRDPRGKATWDSTRFWEESPNHWLIRNCRALLLACRKPTGHDDEHLRALGLLMREYATGDRLEDTAFNSYIKKTRRKDCQCDALRFINTDLKRRGASPELLQEAHERLQELISATEPPDSDSSET